MQHVGHTWTDQEWAETVEPRVWQWLCLQAVEKEMGAVPALQVKRVPIPKGWTIVVDSCTPHAGAPAGPGFGPGGLRVHVCAVSRAIDKLLPGLEDEQPEDTTVNMRSSENPYFPILCWAQRQYSAPFGPLPAGMPVRREEVEGWGEQKAAAEAAGTAAAAAAGAAPALSFASALLQVRGHHKPALLESTTYLLPLSPVYQNLQPLPPSPSPPLPPGRGSAVPTAEDLAPAADCSRRLPAYRTPIAGFRESPGARGGRGSYGTTGRCRASRGAAALRREAAAGEGRCACIAAARR